MKPTIILAHGAYADSSSWNGVIEPLTADGHRVIAWANPLRSIVTDAAALSDLIHSIKGPVLLVGHSYGGAVITNVDPDAGDVVALVYVAGFALEHGESPGDASSLAADLPAQQSTLMAVTQRPVTEAALFEPSGDRPLWRSVASWFIFGELDHNIPAGAHRLMAERANTKHTIQIAGASHVVGVSHPAETAQLVLEAAGAHAAERT
jgi:pimeloyl-ACP methyl ester carboxylesterase